MLISPEEGLLGSVAEVRILSSSRWSVHSELLRIIHPAPESVAAANSLVSVPEAAENGVAAAPEAAQLHVSTPQQAEVGCPAQPAGVCSTCSAEPAGALAEAAPADSSAELRPPAAPGAPAKTSSSSGGSGGGNSPAARNGGGSSIEQAQIPGASTLQPLVAAKAHGQAVASCSSLACSSVPEAGSSGAWGHVELVDVLLCVGAAIGLSGVLLSGLLTLLSAH